MEPFVHLHVHSHYSTLDGLCTIEEIIDKARQDGMRGVAITDHGVMYGIKYFTDKVNDINKDLIGQISELEAKLAESDTADATELQDKIAELKKQLFIPIIGCEVYCARRSRLLKEKDVPNPYAPNKSIDNSGWHLILLAKNYRGYENLVKMVSLSFTEGEYYKPRIDKELLEKYHEGIIVSSACIAGEVPQHILGNRLDLAEESVRWFKNIFGDDYYLEVQLHQTTRKGYNRHTYQKQLLVNKGIFELAAKCGVKVIATNDVHFLNRDDADVHKRLLCVGLGKELADMEVTEDEDKGMSYSGEEWFKTQEEMNEIFKDHPEVLSNTIEILEKVELYSINHDALMPEFAIPEPFKTPSEYLKHLTDVGAAERYGTPLPDVVRERLDFELETINRMGFPTYFLVVWDLIKAARKMGVSIGPGRGSAAGSAVAYTLDITRIDPIKYDLLFERFLNPDRTSLPDIDIDIEDTGRDKVLEYVTEKYGKEKVAHIVTFSQLKAKSAIQDMGRIEQMPQRDRNRICKLIPDKIPGVKVLTLDALIENIPELKEIAENGTDLEKQVLSYAGRVENRVRGTGVHASGVIISATELSKVVPLATAKKQRSTDTSEKGDTEKVVVTQYPGDVIESTGLIKMDFLGLQGLAIIKESLRLIKETTGKDIDIDHIPLDDPKTFDIFSSGNTVAIFQFESPGMQKHLMALKPSRFEDIIAMNALYRPGPMDSIPDYINRRHGKAQIEYNLPEEEEVLKETYGITVYQEQVMRLSRSIAGFTRGESDKLRKGMAKKKEKILAALETKFMKGGEERGHSAETLTQIWQGWKSFAQYAFNKSHSACYAYVAYQEAYLKAHYPAEYMAGNLSCMLRKADEVSKLMKECCAMGINVLSPSVNESHNTFSVTKDGDIRFGIGAIKGVSSSAVSEIIEERVANGPFEDVYAFFKRVPIRSLNRKTIECFVKSGAFDCFGVAREDYFAIMPNSTETDFIAALLAYGKSCQLEEKDSSVSLFGDAHPMEVAKPQPAKGTKSNRLEQLLEESNLIGVFLSGNPLDPYEFIIKHYCSNTTEDLKSLSELEGTNVCLAGYLSDVSSGTWQSANGNKSNEFTDLVINDYAGSYKLRVWGEDTFKYSGYFKENEFLLLNLSVTRPKYDKDKKGDKFFVNVTDVRALSSIADSLINEVTLRFNPAIVDEDFAVDLHTEATKHKGQCALIFNMYNPKLHYSLNLAPEKIRIQPGSWLCRIIEKYELQCQVK